MGWVNYIVVPKLKLIVETSRNVNKLEEWQIKAFHKFADLDAEVILDIQMREMKKITLSELKVLVEAAEVATWFVEFADEFLLYWLEQKDLEHEVISEFDMEKRTFPKDYTRLESI